MVTLDTRALDGIQAAFSGHYVSGHDTLTLLGAPEAAARLMAAYQEAMGRNKILGAQPILNEQTKH